MLQEEWLDWALEVASATSYGVCEVLDCARLLEGRVEEEVIKSDLSVLLEAMGSIGVEVRPSDLLKGLILASDLAKMVGGVLQEFFSSVSAGTPLTDTNSASQSDVDSPDDPDVRRAQEGLDSSESVLKSGLCDDPPLCAECGRPLIVSPEESDARGSYNPMAACNYCKRQGRLEDLKRGD